MDSIKAKEQFVNDDIAQLNARIDEYEEQLLAKIAVDPDEPVDLLR